jgi:hypothetical protein
MKGLKISVIIFIIFLSIISCKKNDIETNKSNTEKIDPISDTPAITLINVTPTTVTQLNDSIVFTIQYQDGNGDIGYKNADSTSLFLTDNRANLIEKYHIQPLTPSGSDIIIQGNLKIVLDRTAILDTTQTQETTTYTIKLKDRAGNWSNEIITETITINK